jgi:glycosyltransferase involved in cell wall biosynthesis
MMLPVFLFFKEVIFCSNACRESFPALYRWLVRDKAHVVQNAVDLERIDRSLAKHQDGRKDTRFDLVSIGRIIKIKNPFAILKAFQQTDDQNSYLTYVGEGALRAPLAQAIEEMGLANKVKLTGLVSRDEVFQYAAQADLFVSTSYGEGLPVAVEEAMACGCPVILSDIPPHREIAEGVDFIPLIHADDVEGFAREIERFRAMSSVERQAIGQQCREIIERRFTLPIMHANLARIYSRLPRGGGINGTVGEVTSG